MFQWMIHDNILLAKLTIFIQCSFLLMPPPYWCILVSEWKARGAICQTLKCFWEAKKLNCVRICYFMSYKFISLPFKKINVPFISPDLHTNWRLSADDMVLGFIVPWSPAFTETGGSWKMIHISKGEAVVLCCKSMGCPLCSGRDAASSGGV